MSTKTAARRYATVNEAAAYMSCSTKTVHRLLADPDSGINRYEVLSAPRLDLNEVDAYLSRNIR